MFERRLDIDSRKWNILDLVLVDNREFEFRTKSKAIYNNLSIVQSQEFEATWTKQSRLVFVLVFERTTRRDKIINCFPYLRCSYVQGVSREVFEIFREINRVDIIIHRIPLHAVECQIKIPGK